MLHHRARKSSQDILVQPGALCNCRRPDRMYDRQLSTHINADRVSVGETRDGDTMCVVASDLTCTLRDEVAIVTTSGTVGWQSASNVTRGAFQGRMLY